MNGDVSFDESATERANELSVRYGVSKRVHRDDFIFEFIFNKADITDKADAVSEYIESGHATIGFLRSILSEHAVQIVLDQGGKDRPTLLEFAAGYGRVTRHFPAHLSAFDVVACDIHPSAVAFLKELGHNAILSQHRPGDFALDKKFDVIFAFSFFTHMPKSTWGLWLQALGEHLTSDGVLIFTTHGEVSQRLMGVDRLDSDGFFFHAVSEQKDLDKSEYGNCITTFGFVADQIEQAHLKPLIFKEAGAGHHDVYAVTRPPSRNGEGPRTRKQAIETEISALRNSTSWRMTAPMRGVVDMVRRWRSTGRGKI